MFEKGNDIKATVGAYNAKWSIAYATLDLGGTDSFKMVVVKVPIDQIGKLSVLPTKGKLPIKDVALESPLLEKEIDVIFKNARYTGADSSGTIWTYEADAIEFL